MLLILHWMHLHFIISISTWPVVYCWCQPQQSKHCHMLCIKPTVTGVCNLEWETWLSRKWKKSWKPFVSNRGEWHTQCIPTALTGTLVYFCLWGGSSLLEEGFYTRKHLETYLLFIRNVSRSAWCWLLSDICQCVTAPAVRDVVKY